MNRHDRLAIYRAYLGAERPYPPKPKLKQWTPVPEDDPDFQSYMKLPSWQRSHRIKRPRQPERGEWDALYGKKAKQTLKRWQKLGLEPNQPKLVRAAIRQEIKRVREEQRRRNWGRAAEYVDILRGDPCCYCGVRMEHIDHIVPVAAGGRTEWDNLTAACGSCNMSKQATPLLAFLLSRRFS